MEEKNNISDIFSINESEKNEIKKPPSSTFKYYLMTFIIIFLIIAIGLFAFFFFFYNKGDKQEPNNNEHPTIIKDANGYINCIYKINDTSQKIPIINEKFENFKKIQIKKKKNDKFFEFSKNFDFDNLG